MRLMKKSQATEWRKKEREMIVFSCVMRSCFTFKFALNCSQSRIYLYAWLCCEGKSKAETLQSLSLLPLTCVYVCVLCVCCVCCVYTQSSLTSPPHCARCNCKVFAKRVKYMWLHTFYFCFSSSFSLAFNLSMRWQRWICLSKYEL